MNCNWLWLSTSLKSIISKWSSSLLWCVLLEVDANVWTNISASCLWMAVISSWTFNIYCFYLVFSCGAVFSCQTIRMGVFLLMDSTKPSFICLIKFLAIAFCFLYFIRFSLKIKKKKKKFGWIIMKYFKDFVLYFSLCVAFFIEPWIIIWFCYSI